MEGKCLRFHLHLKKLIPDAEGFYDHNHIITKIGDRFYDDKGWADSKGFLPFETMLRNIRSQFDCVMTEEDKFLWSEIYGKKYYYRN